MKTKGFLKALLLVLAAGLLGFFSQPTPAQAETIESAPAAQGSNTCPLYAEGWVSESVFDGKQICRNGYWQPYIDKTIIIGPAQPDPITPPSPLDPVNIWDGVVTCDDWGAFNVVGSSLIARCDADLKWRFSCTVEGQTLSDTLNGVDLYTCSGGRWTPTQNIGIDTPQCQPGTGYADDTGTYDCVAGQWVWISPEVPDSSLPVTPICGTCAPAPALDNYWSYYWHQ